MPIATAEQHAATPDGAAAGGCALGRYLLAATFGNVHGTLRPRVLADGQKAVAEAHLGARSSTCFKAGRARRRRRSARPSHTGW